MGLRGQQPWMKVLGWRLESFGQEACAEAGAGVEGWRICV